MSLQRSTIVNKLKDNWPIFIPVIVVIIALIVGIKGVLTDEQPYLVGTIEADFLSVASEIPGRLEMVLVEEGDTVKIGDTLMIMHSQKINSLVEQTNAMLSAADANEQLVMNGAKKSTLLSSLNFYKTTQEQYSLAEKNYQRGVKLYNDSIISKVELELLKFKRNSAKREMESAKNQYLSLKSGTRKESKLIAKAGVNQAKSANELMNKIASDVVITARADGIVTDLVVSSGEVVNTGYPLMSIMKYDDMYAILQLKQSELLPYQVGDTLEAYILGVSKSKEETFKFRIIKRASMLDFAEWTPTNLKGSFDMKTVEITLKPIDKIEGLIPGMTVGFIPKEK